MTFGKAIHTCLVKKYVDFSGRAGRAEYWWFMLFLAVVDISIGINRMVYGGILEIVGPLFLLATLLPSLGVAWRRFHDAGWRGWWALISLIPIVGWIFVIVWLCRPGTEGENQYGPDPRIA